MRRIVVDSQLCTNVGTSYAGELRGGYILIAFLVKALYPYPRAQYIPQIQIQARVEAAKLKAEVHICPCTNMPTTRPQPVILMLCTMGAQDGGITHMAPVAAHGETIVNPMLAASDEGAADSEVSFRRVVALLSTRDHSPSSRL